MSVCAGIDVKQMELYNHLGYFIVLSVNGKNKLYLTVKITAISHYGSIQTRQPSQILGSDFKRKC
jgi:hypothetical protein